MLGCKELIRKRIEPFWATRDHYLHQIQQWHCFIKGQAKVLQFCKIIRWCHLFNIVFNTKDNSYIQPTDIVNCNTDSHHEGIVRDASPWRKLYITDNAVIANRGFGLNVAVFQQCSLSHTWWQSLVTVYETSLISGDFLLTGTTSLHHYFREKVTFISGKNKNTQKVKNRKVFTQSQPTIISITNSVHSCNKPQPEKGRVSCIALWCQWSTVRGPYLLRPQSKFYIKPVLTFPNLRLIFQFCFLCKSIFTDQSTNNEWGEWWENKIWRSCRLCTLFKMLTRERKILFVSNGLVSNFTLTNLQYQVSRSGQLGINPFHPKIGVYILHIVLFTFLLIQTMRICLTIRSFLNLWSFPLHSWPYIWFKGDTVSRNWKLATLICYKINQELSVQTTCYRMEKTNMYLYSIT